MYAIFAHRCFSRSVDKQQKYKNYFFYFKFIHLFHFNSILCCFCRFGVSIRFLNNKKRETNMTSFANTLAVTLTTAFLLTICIHLSYSCNEQVCASIVSKCMLTQSCKCDLKNCSCCKECFNCLSYLYNECCSCVGKWTTQNALSLSPKNSNDLLLFTRYVSPTERHEKCTLEEISC